MRRLGLYSIFIVGIFGCENPNHKNFLQFAQEVCVDREILRDIVFVVIPTTGCVGCISPAINFLKKNIDDPTYQFIITEVTDKKHLKMWLGENVFKNEHLIIDYANKWRSNNLQSEYPMIAIISSNKVSQLKYIDIQLREIWNEYAKDA